MPPGDRDLVALALSGDSRAFEALVLRHYGFCLRFAWRQLGNRADAEDVVQTSMMRAYASLHRCRDPERFRSWLLAIVVNRCRSHAGLARRRLRRLREWWLGRTDAVAPPPEPGDPQRLLDRLPPLLREAVLLKHVEGLTYEEMSAMLGVSVSALKMRVKRATDRLAGLLESADE